MKKPLIIIPAYNAAKELESVLLKLKEHKATCLIVNDGSTDNTKNIVQHLGFNSINLSTNTGVSNAIIMGLQYALQNDYQHVVLMDADGQHNPTHLNRFIKALAHHDFVFANRFYSPSSIPSCKIASNAFASAIYSTIANCFIPDVACGYKAFKISPDLINYLESSNGYSIVYRLTNYIVLKKHPVHFIPTDAIYHPNDLLCTRTSELVSLLESAMELNNSCSASSPTADMLRNLFQRVLLHQNFSFPLQGIQFYAFYIETYDGYIMQASLHEVFDYYER